MPRVTKQEEMKNWISSFSIFIFSVKTPESQYRTNMAVMARSRPEALDVLRTYDESFDIEYVDSAMRIIY